jgi:hypothetical protein
MFGLFKKKDPKDILYKKYKKLSEEAYKLSRTDRKSADLKMEEADKILAQIEKLESAPEQ